MEYETLIYEKRTNTGIIRLNRPERMNAVIEQMYIDIQGVLAKASDDKEVRVLVLTGSEFQKKGITKQAFCAGADLKEHASGNRTSSDKRKYIELAHDTTRKIFEFIKPTIATVNGPARGAGAEMALNCDFIFMANNASIAFPETSLGTFVGGGTTYHLPAIVGQVKAKELVYTGRTLNGKEAVSYGLAYMSSPIEKLMNKSLEFAEILAEKAPHSMRLAKECLQNSNNKDIKTILGLETEAILSCMETEDWHEGIKAFGEKRKPVYKGK